MLLTALWWLTSQRELGEMGPGECNRKANCRATTSLRGLGLGSYGLRATFLAFHRKFDVLGQLKLQTVFGSNGYVLCVLCLRRIAVRGIALGRAFARRIKRVGYQLVGLPVQVDRSESHGQLRRTLLLAVTTRPVMCVPFGITVFPFTLMDEDRIAAKESPAWFLLLASASPTVALIAVPFGTVTSDVCCVTLLEAATGLAGAPFTATTLPGAAFLVVGLAAAGLAAAAFAAAAFLAWAGVWFVAWSVAWFEQPATLKNAAAATARKNLRRPWELSIFTPSKAGTLGVNGMRWLVGPPSPDQFTN